MASLKRMMKIMMKSRLTNKPEITTITVGKDIFLMFC